MATDVIGCLEHECLPIVENRSPGQKALEPKHVQLLAKIENQLPANAFRWGHNSIKWTQYCGVIQLGDLTLEILPKIYGREDDPGSCRHALIRMLKKAKVLKSHEGGQASMNIQRHTLYFCNYSWSILCVGFFLALFCLLRDRKAGSKDIFLRCPRDWLSK